jgi:hypothetical protein
MIIIVLIVFCMILKLIIVVNVFRMENVLKMIKIMTMILFVFVHDVINWWSMWIQFTSIWFYSRFTYGWLFERSKDDLSFNYISIISYWFIKLIQITFGIINLESCKTVSYLLSVFTRLTYWLISWVTIDRLLIIIFPTSITLKNPRRAIGISLTTSLCLFVMHIHEIIYYKIIQQSV